MPGVDAVDPIEDLEGPFAAGGAGGLPAGSPVIAVGVPGEGSTLGLNLIPADGSLPIRLTDGIYPLKDGVGNVVPQAYFRNIDPGFTGIAFWDTGGDTPLYAEPKQILSAGTSAAAPPGDCILLVTAENDPDVAVIAQSDPAPVIVLIG